MAQVIAAADQAALAWVGRRRATLLTMGGGLVAAEVWAVRNGGGLTLTGMLIVLLLAWGLCRWVGLAVWWNRRRRLLARHSLPAPGPVAMFSDRRLEQQRMRYVHKQWVAFCQANGVTGVGKIIPKLHKVTGTVSGDLTALIAPGPLSVKGGVEKIQGLSSTIAETCGCVEVLVRHTGVGYATLSFLWTEAMERVLPVAELPRSRTGQMVYGVRRDGKPASLTIGLSVLVSGLTGSGKSGISWSLLADLVRQEINVDLYASDPKGGIELGVLADKVGDETSRLKVVDYCSSADDTKRLIDKCEKAMKERQQGQEQRAWTVADADQQPLIILLIDECVEVLALMKTAGPTNNRGLYLTKLKTIISQGRASGVMILASTQMAQKEVLGDVRDMFAQRLCLATRNAINTDMVLGDGAEAAGALCSKIVNRPGVGYSFDESRRGFELFRGAWCDDDDIRRISLGHMPEGIDMGGKGEVDESVALYQLHNKDRVLYRVGITNDVPRRMSEYAKSAPWFKEVVIQPGDILWKPNRAVALAEEDRTIHAKWPIYNDQHNKQNPLRRGWDWTFQSTPSRPTKRTSRLPAVPEPVPASELALNVTPINYRKAVAQSAKNRKKAS